MEEGIKTLPTHPHPAIRRRIFKIIVSVLLLLMVAAKEGKKKKHQFVSEGNA